MCTEICNPDTNSLVCVKKIVVFRKEYYILAAVWKIQFLLLLLPVTEVIEERTTEEEESKAEATEEPSTEEQTEEASATEESSKAETTSEEAPKERKKSLAEKVGGAVSSLFGIGSSKKEESKEASKKDSKEAKVEEEVAKWGKPLGLPSPLHPGGSSRSLNNDNNRSGKSSSKKTEKKFTPLYMDLAYVPHHGDANYTDIEFFKRVRARYYVFSGVEPSRAVFDALLEAKKTWENKDLGNCIKNHFYNRTFVYIIKLDFNWLIFLQK